MAAELAADALRQLRVGGLKFLQWVIEAELAPLVATHLVKAQDLHALDSFQAGDEMLGKELE